MNRAKKIAWSVVVIVGCLFAAYTIASAAGCTPFLVASGGTGNCTFSKNAILTGNGTGAVIASSSQPLYVGSINATTTATSTFTGGVQADIFNAASTTASSTFANGLNIKTGCVAYNNVCISPGSGTVTSISLGGGLDGPSPITTSGTITAQVGTSTVPTAGQLAFWTGILTPSTLGTVATSAAICSGSVSCSGFTVVGTVSPTLTVTNSIANGLTATTTGGYTNGVYFYDGISMTNDNVITHQKGANTGFGTTSPIAQVSISTSTASAPTTQLLNIASSTNDTIATVLGGGKIGIGTSTPYGALTVGRNAAVASTSILGTEWSPGTTTASTIDCRDSNQIHWRLGTSGTTLTLAPMVPGQTCRVIVENSGGTAGTITWAVSSGQQLHWIGGTIPTQTTTGFKTDVWSFLSSQGSSTVQILGAASLNF